MLERDGFIDGFKGFLILWVIQIHTVFWSGELYLPDAVRQVSLLIDVPAFFFISGYLVNPSDVVRFVRRSVRQFCRLYLTYLVISCGLLVVLWTGASLFRGEGAVSLWPAVTSMIKLRPTGELWNIIPVYGGSLWFIRVYLVVLVLLPLLIGLVNVRNLKLLLLVSLLALLYVGGQPGWGGAFLLDKLSFVNFYLFIYLLGAIYRTERQSIRLNHLALSLLATLMGCVIAFQHDGQLILQANKFPPSFQYLAYSLLLIHAFVIGERIWKIGDWSFLQHTGSVLKWCGTNVFSLFLFQGVACSFGFYLVPLLRDHVADFTLYAMMLAFNVCVTVGLAYLYARLEAMTPGRWKWTRVTAPLGGNASPGPSTGRS